jgi:hypothetical protein
MASIGVSTFDSNAFVRKVLTYNRTQNLDELMPNQIDIYIDSNFLEYEMYQGEGFTNYISVFNLIINSFMYMKINENYDGENTAKYVSKIKQFIEFRNKEILGQSYHRVAASIKNKDFESDDEYYKTRKDKADTIYKGLHDKYESDRLASFNVVYSG